MNREVGLDSHSPSHDDDDDDNDDDDDDVEFHVLGCRLTYQGQTVTSA